MFATVDLHWQKTQKQMLLSIRLSGSNLHIKKYDNIVSLRIGSAVLEISIAACKVLFHDPYIQSVCGLFQIEGIQADVLPAVA